MTGPARHSLILTAALLAVSPLLLGPTSARADELSRRAIEFPGTVGLGGFQDMVDARIPTRTFTFRGGFRYDIRVRERDFSGTVQATTREERHDGALYAAASLFSVVEVAARLPYVYERVETDLQTNANQQSSADGVGNLDLAAKVTLSLGPVELSPFMFGRIPAGSAEIEDLASFEYGLAGAFSFLNDYLAIHTNLSGFQLEEGLTALRYRIGLSFVILAEAGFAIRAYCYGDGIEFEGSAGSDFDLEFGGQAMLLVGLFVEAGASVRLHDGSNFDSTAENAVDSSGGFVNRFEDVGTWQITLATGVMF